MDPLVSTDNVFEPQIREGKCKESCKDTLPRLQRAKSATIECKQWTALACPLPIGTFAFLEVSPRGLLLYAKKQNSSFHSFPQKTKALCTSHEFEILPWLREM